MTRGGDFNRCHSCRPPSEALNSLRSGVPSAFVGEGMSKKLRPALTQMFAYLYLARVLNIFCSALGGITNAASVTRIFHEKKNVFFFFPEIFLGGKSYVATNSATGCLRRREGTRSPQLFRSMAAAALRLVFNVCDALFGLRRSQLNSFSANPRCRIFHVWSHLVDWLSPLMTMHSRMHMCLSSFSLFVIVALLDFDLQAHGL